MGTDAWGCRSADIHSKMLKAGTVLFSILRSLGLRESRFPF
jgi:hypothetical protein